MTAWPQRFSRIEAVLASVQDPDDRELVHQALLSERSAEGLAQVLAERGLPISPSSIRTYRRAMRQAGEPTQ